MASVTGVRKLAFFYTATGGIGTRNVVISSADVPLNTALNVKIRHLSGQITMHFNGVEVASQSAPLIYSGALPLAAGGHYGTNAYNMNGLLKNITVTRI